MRSRPLPQACGVRRPPTPDAPTGPLDRGSRHGPMRAATGHSPQSPRPSPTLMPPRGWRRAKIPPVIRPWPMRFRGWRNRAAAPRQAAALTAEALKHHAGGAGRSGRGRVSVAPCWMSMAPRNWATGAEVVRRRWKSGTCPRCWSSWFNRGVWIQADKELVAECSVKDDPGECQHKFHGPEYRLVRPLLFPVHASLRTQRWLEAFPPSLDSRRPVDRSIPSPVIPATSALL